jgi:hypothetical protein
MTTEGVARLRPRATCSPRSTIASLGTIQLSNSPTRRDPLQPRLRDLAAYFARGLILSVPPSSTEGAGNAGCALHPWPPVQQKSTGVSNQGYTASAGIPCTMVLRLIRALPGDRALLPPSPVVRSHELSASVGAPGPHDFAVRDSIIRRAKKLHLTLPRPSHPASNVRDDREAPLLWERDGDSCKFDLGSSRSDLFSHTGLDRFSQRRGDLPVGQSHNASHCEFYRDIYQAISTSNDVSSGDTSARPVPSFRGDAKASNPESRDSGFASRPGMTG